MVDIRRCKGRCYKKRAVTGIGTGTGVPYGGRRSSASGLARKVTAA